MEIGGEVAALDPEAAKAELTKRNIELTGDAFTQAAANGQDDVVGLFLAAGFSPDSTNKYSYTPLMFAAGRGQASTVEMLVAHKATVDAVSRDNMTALMSAAAEGRRCRSCNSCSITAPNINAKRGDDTTALIWAASNGKAEMVSFLVSKGAEIEAKDRLGATALIEAALNPTQEDANGQTLAAVEKLLAAGANVHATARDGETALMTAATKGEDGIVEKLLDAGAEVNAVDVDGQSALMHTAIQKAAPATTRLLLKRGAKVNLQSKDGSTALMFAARRKMPGVLKCPSWRAGPTLI